MFKFLWNPVAQIAFVKKERSFGKSLLILALAALFGLISVFVSKGDREMSTVNLAFILFFATIIGVFFLAFLFRMVMNIIAKPQRFFEAFTILTYGTFIMMLGFLISMLVAFIPTIAGSILTVLVLLFAMILANALILRAGMDFYQADLLTVIVGLAVVFLAVFITAAIIVFNTFLAARDMVGPFGAAGAI